MYSKKFMMLALISSALWIMLCGSGFAKEPIQIGLVTSLSGAFAPQGEEVNRAIRFAIEEANQRGGIDGREVKFKFADDESSPDGARRGAERLVRAGYNLLIGPIASSMSLALSQNLDRWDAAYFMVLSKADKLTGEACQPRMFRCNPSDSMDAAMINNWLKDVKEKKFSTLAVDYVWGHDSTAFFKKTANSMNKEIVLELFAPMGTKDYAPYISKLAYSGSEAVWVALIGKDINAFAKQAAEFGLMKKMKIVGHAFIFDYVVQATGSATEGIIGNIGYSASIPVERNRRFVEAWKKKFGDEPTENEGAAYNGTITIFQGVKLSGSVKPKDVARALSGATIETIYGPVKMRAEDNQMLLPTYMGQVKKIGGKYKVVVEKSFGPSVIPPPSGACKMPKLQEKS